MRISNVDERLALSKNKEEVINLSRSGQLIVKPSDAIKDPYVLEFLGLQELPTYSESALECKIIDHLQQFLLELGKGFAFVGRQMQMYVNYYDRKVKLKDENKTIGIILCKGQKASYC